MSLMSKKRKDQNAISHNDLTPGVVRLEQVRVICPGCGEEVLASVSDGWVRGFCAVVRWYVNFLAETQRIDNPTPETAEISASVKKQLQDLDPDEVVRAYLRGAKTIDIQREYKITPGKMYRVLHGAGVKLRTSQENNNSAGANEGKRWQIK